MMILLISLILLLLNVVNGFRINNNNNVRTNNNGLKMSAVNKLSFYTAELYSSKYIILSIILILLFLYCL